MLDPLTFGLGKKVAPTSIASPAATSIAPAAAPSISPPAATSTNHSRRASSSPSRNSSRARTQETDTEGGGRTQVPPTGATRIQPTRKVKHKSQTLNAPYVKLTPISDDQSDLMDVDSMEDEKTVRSNTSSIMKPPIIGQGCGNPVCVSLSENDHGCVDASPDPETGHISVTEATFLCPRCHRVRRLAMNDFLHRNYFPLLAIFLSWSGFRTPFPTHIIKSTLEEHFRRDTTRVRIVTRALKAGNNRPSAMKPHFDWLRQISYLANMLIFVNTHSDANTGHLVVAGNEHNPLSVPINELLSNYIGDDNLRDAAHAISAINKRPSVGPCMRGMIICACGSTGRVTDSAYLLKRIVEK
ncbi:uncharacterized protein EDB93DRAFT_1110359 [Suillus bovinus]|uniref:uncharacterized protein n=1 Tax=Suillus bovinus TaxID=48563 RepID=UPI001B876255|nr:uncharacterized protein EDB93DRAFT_1110359 [Suillus bovinus]KAG2125066.1 hypothetical protein EDB93DRAFT_1110359 [Suillus bovinus]